MPKILTALFVAMICLVSAPPADATPLDEVVATIENSGGRYVWGGASLAGSDCSGLVSVAQSLAMGQAPHRLGDTHTLLAGQWPGAIPGASPDDAFIIGTSSTHMVARIEGVDIESMGGRFRVGDEAASPWAPQFTRQYHLDPTLIRT